MTQLQQPQQQAQQQVFLHQLDLPLQQTAQESRLLHHQPELPQQVALAVLLLGFVLHLPLLLSSQF